MHGAVLTPSVARGSLRRAASDVAKLCHGGLVDPAPMTSLPPSHWLAGNARALRTLLDSRGSSSDVERTQRGMTEGGPRSSLHDMHHWQYATRVVAAIPAPSMPASREPRRGGDTFVQLRRKAARAGKDAMRGHCETGNAMDATDCQWYEAGGTAQVRLPCPVPLRLRNGNMSPPPLPLQQPSPPPAVACSRGATLPLPGPSVARPPPVLGVAHRGLQAAVRICGLTSSSAEQARLLARQAVEEPAAVHQQPAMRTHCTHCSAIAAASAKDAAEWPAGSKGAATAAAAGLWDVLHAMESHADPASPTAQLPEAQRIKVLAVDAQAATMRRLQLVQRLNTTGHSAEAALRDGALSQRMRKGFADTLQLYRSATAKCIECIVKWKAAVGGNTPFVHRGRNVLLTMAADLDFLQHLPRVVEWLHLPTVTAPPARRSTPAAPPGREARQGSEATRGPHRLGASRRLDTRRAHNLLPTGLRDGLLPRATQSSPHPGGRPDGARSRAKCVMPVENVFLLAAPRPRVSSALGSAHRQQFEHTVAPDFMAHIQRMAAARAGALARELLDRLSPPLASPEPVSPPARPRVSTYPNVAAPDDSSPRAKPRALSCKLRVHSGSPHTSAVTRITVPLLPPSPPPEAPLQAPPAPAVVASSFHVPPATVHSKGASVSRSATVIVALPTSIPAALARQASVPRVPLSVRSLRQSKSSFAGSRARGPGLLAARAVSAVVQQHTELPAAQSAAAEGCATTMGSRSEAVPPPTPADLDAAREHATGPPHMRPFRPTLTPISSQRGRSQTPSAAALAIQRVYRGWLAREEAARRRMVRQREEEEQSLQSLLRWRTTQSQPSRAAASRRSRPSSRTSASGQARRVSSRRAGVRSGHIASPLGAGGDTAQPAAPRTAHHPPPSSSRAVSLLGALSWRGDRPEDVDAVMVPSDDEATATLAAPTR